MLVLETVLLLREDQRVQEDEDHVGRVDEMLIDRHVRHLVAEDAQGAHTLSLDILLFAVRCLHQELSRPFSPQGGHPLLSFREHVVQKD